MLAEAHNFECCRSLTPCRHKPCPSGTQSLKSGDSHQAKNPAGTERSVSARGFITSERARKEENLRGRSVGDACYECWIIKGHRLGMDGYHQRNQGGNIGLTWLEIRIRYVIAI